MGNIILNAFQPRKRATDNIEMRMRWNEVCFGTSLQ